MYMYILVPLPVGVYFSGDGGARDAEGDYQITGRVDDVMNVKGHRIGTAELESCMVSGWWWSWLAQVDLYTHDRVTTLELRRLLLLASLMRFLEKASQACSIICFETPFLSSDALTFYRYLCLCDFERRSG